MEDAKIAEKQFGDNKNITILEWHLELKQGFLVYSFTDKDQITNAQYTRLIDPGNGIILFKSDANLISESIGKSFWTAKTLNTAWMESFWF